MVPGRDVEGGMLHWTALTTDRDDRKKAEEALQSSERTLRLMISAIPTYIHVLRTDGSVLYANPAVLDYFGITLEDTQKEDYRTRFFHPEDVERLRDERREALQRPVPFEHEQRVLGKDGLYRWFLIRYSPLLNEEGKIDRWYAAATDIEDRKKAESRLRQVIDTIPALAWTILPDGSNEFLSKRWEEYTGLSVDESHGWGWQVAFHPEDLPRVMEKWRKMLVSGESDEIETRLRRHDGVYRWFLIRAQAFRDDSGNIVRWYGTSTDIEDLKQAQEARRASERNLAAIINTIPTTAWTTRPDGYCDFLNQVWLDYTGLTVEKAQGWGWAEAIHPDDRKNLVEEWQACLASGTQVDTEARIRRFDGSYRWFLIRANPLRDESGNILKWYGTCVDIEDRKRAEEALQSRELDARSLLDNMPGFLGRHSPDGTPEIVNGPFLQYLGKTVEEIGTWRTSDLVHPDDFAPTGEVMGDAVSTGQPCDFECRLRRFDGVYRWFQSRWVPVRDVERRILHWN